MWHGRREVQVGFWWGNLRDSVYLEGLIWKDNIKIDLQEVG